MHAIWGLGQAMFSKVIVVVDEDVDVQNVREVAWKALNNIDPERDIQFVMGPVDSLDHASRLPNYGSKMGIDATRKWPGEGFTRSQFLSRRSCFQSTDIGVENKVAPLRFGFRLGRRRRG